MLTALAAISGVCLFVVWIGYPVVMMLLSGTRSRGYTPLPATLPTVTVVIATRDGADAVNARVLDVLQADYPPSQLDVVVAIDAAAPASSPDGLGAARPRVTIVPGDAPGGKATGLNAGVRAAKGEIVVYTDTHQRFDPQTIPELVRAFADPRLGAVSGCLHNSRTSTQRSLAERYWTYERRLREAEARVHSAVGATGAVWALRRALWSPLPAGLILDDVYTPMRLVLGGHRVGFARSARAFETRQFTPGQEYQRKVRTLTGVVQLCAWLPRILIPVVNPIWTQFVFHKLLRLFTPYLAAVIALWSIVAVGRYAAGSMNPGVLAALALSTAALFGVTRFRRVAREGWLLQRAMVIAAVNGARGRWDVWQR